MAAHAVTGSTASLSDLPLPSYVQSNHIDLTLDDDDDSYGPHTLRFAKRPRTDLSGPQRNDQFTHHTNPFDASTSRVSPFTSPLSNINSPFVKSSVANSTPYLPTVAPSQTMYRPAFAGPPPYIIPRPPQTSNITADRSSSITSPPSSQLMRQSFSEAPARQVIDLTGSPSPPPTDTLSNSKISSLPPELPPKTPVCIGQLTVTALILYPVPYLVPQEYGRSEEWAPVRLQYEHNPNKPGGSETIHIRTPHGRGPNGETVPGEGFAVIEQKVATALGPMLGKGLIRLDAKVKKGPPNLPILPLQMLVYTPKGNIPVVGSYLKESGLFLDHPSPPYDVHRLSSYHYHNPHNPPPGGYNRAVFVSNRMNVGPQRENVRWSTPSMVGKSVEVQRSQVDELFKSLKDGDELEETEPTADVATQLYPHQKKALTFLLEREREKAGADGNYSSLWQKRQHPLSRQISWFHIVTQKEIFEEPREAKGSILADDMGLGKTITCVSLIAATRAASHAFAASPLEPIRLPPPPRETDHPDASHFSGAVWGMPDVVDAPQASNKGKAKANKSQDKLEADYARACRIKAKSRATLIICPLSTVSNWEDQFREHWKGDVVVFGGSGGTCMPSNSAPPSIQPSLFSNSMLVDTKPVAPSQAGNPLRVYIYHGNARRPDPAFLGDFDAVITTYATLASEFSKQNRSTATADDDEDDAGSSDGVGGVDIDEYGNQVLRLPKSKKTGMKRKKSTILASGAEVTSALQSIHWFRVVLDEAHSIKETGTVGSRASCDLVADRRLCLTGTPVQNKLDDVFALIKFLRLEPFDDKNTWTEYIGSPVKFGQALGVARLQTIMKCITLRRTKETETQDGKKILDLPPRRDELRYLKFDSQEQEIYDQFFNESKAEFNDLSTKNEVMKNYVGILQKILRLRQICDHFELVKGKGVTREDNGQDATAACDDLVSDIAQEGFNLTHALSIFAILRESATTQCVECGGELGIAPDLQGDGLDGDGPPTAKRGRKAKGSNSRGPTRANSPSSPRPVLTRCQHLFCFECYRNSICPGWPNVSPDTRRSCSACQTGLCPSDAVEIKADLMADQIPRKKTQKREKRQKGIPIENFHPSTKVRALLQDLVEFSRMNPYSANYDSEVQVVDGQGNHLDSGVVKTVVFSQWTTMLDKIEDALEVAGIRYDRLDGTMKRDDRTKAMDALKTDPGCEVLLVSLKAGGVGLNLTAAQRVYLMDPYWNPAVENQAVDRIHRLGQTRPVTTVKLIIENSIEARLLEVQKKKTALANMTLGQNFSKSDLLARRLEELAQLFSTNNSTGGSIQ